MVSSLPMFYTLYVMAGIGAALALVAAVMAFGLRASVSSPGEARVARAAA